MTIKNVGQRIKRNEDPRLLTGQALFVDDIVAGAAVSHPRALAALLELEMSGLIRQLPGKNFIRKL